MPTYALHTLADLPTDRPMPLIDRRRIMGERMMISEVVLYPGFEVSTHYHENEQMVVMLEGRAEFTIGDGRRSFSRRARCWNCHPTCPTRARRSSSAASWTCSVP